MSLVAIPAAIEAALAHRSEPAPVTRTTTASSSSRPHAKANAETAWAAWQVDGHAPAGVDFLGRVSSWADGTVAQLLRQRWPAGTRRPTAPEVLERLHHHLLVIARGAPVAHLDALASARLRVIEELRRDRTTGLVP